jgi:hypothetical protein
MLRDVSEGASDIVRVACTAVSFSIIIILKTLPSTFGF